MSAAGLYKEYFTTNEVIIQKVGAGKCCLSGEITQRKEDKCGCPIICEGLCTVPEGLPCDPEKDVCADGTKCTIQELSMMNEHLGKLRLAESIFK